ncbi:histone-lysine N-methyltransferase EHMT2 [Phymastichus coffea]|uniref:histone-lysine N-methyltransferase EHMT2 n=1 Tax=Phymastichus coffea TaxID=108790 RepID=UPI00273CDF97|nr:histone-lysine N-methyltransferase EHMT2 [Phymastichus coffea]
MPKLDCVEANTVVVNQGDTDDEDVSPKDTISIQQILDCMTNEFNKTGTKKGTDSSRKVNRTEQAVRKVEKVQVREESPKAKRIPKVTNQIIEEEIKIIKENIPEKKVEKAPSEEETVKVDDVTKKDEKQQRIVLTFRTIDENTDHGKKTKICTSTLVPDELANCDTIRGVSVKVEGYDDARNDINKSDSEDCSKQTVASDTELLNKEEKKEQEENKNHLEKDSIVEETQSVSDMNPVSMTNGDASLEEKSVEVENTSSTTKRKQKQLKESSETEEPSLKRSARRLSKETSKSTVLESAMARKERSNYTEESTKRRYTKPGRPRKISVEKRDSNSKALEKAESLDKTHSFSKAADKIDSIPQLKPLDPSKWNTDKIMALPKLSPLDPTKWAVDKKDLPKLSPLKPQKEVVTVDNEKNGLDAVSLQKLNKYEGMPKLTPIVKTAEILSQFSEVTIHNISSSNAKNRSLLKRSNEAFLKPTLKIKKREKPRPVTVSNDAKAHSTEATLSATESENSMEDVILEEESIQPKRTRRNMVPSPSTAEGQASTPESTAILNNRGREKPANNKHSESMQCLCEVRSQLYVTITSAESPLYCTAQDSIDNKNVVCGNEVDHDDVAMRRPSTNIPYIILCRTHKERLTRHNCCPTCGLFCSQGKFVHCSNGHQYHRNCELLYNDKPLCPHCGSYGISYDVFITMTGKRKPMTLASRKQVPKEPAAKITLPGVGDNAKLAEQQPIRKKSVGPLIDPAIIKIPETVVGEKIERYTVMSLYNAVKSGDVQKLVNVLACGYNANHVFRDQGHKTGLHLASDKGHVACVHVLVQAGAQIDVLDRNQLSPLMLAANNGEAEVVRYLMRTGADEALKGEDGMTALHMAAKSGHLEVCKIILEECKVPRTLVDSTDDGGWTSLIWACEFKHVEVVRFLLNSKCDPLIRDAEQNISLHWSAFSGSSEITEMLLNAGCDPSTVNVHGDTPLHIASRKDQYDVCVLLLSRGARVREMNIMGETAIDCCGGTGDTLNALQLNFKVNQNADNLSEKTTRILTNDISRGKETNPVQCVNGFDLEDKPTDFVYVTESCFTSRINIDRTITSLQSCRCEDNCSSDKCLCANISLRCWYDEEGKLVPEFNYADPPMLFECNPACDCNKITCNNRVVQHGLTQRFQLFRTEGKGWGLRTLRHIPKGSYVCEYVGEIISDSEADQREDDSYLFDLDNRDGETYCIDARRYGNLARFINHSCAPNLLPVRIYIEHQDLHFPRIAFFANRDIEADEELGFDYGEKFWIIKCKSFTCTCGAEHCKYSDTTIQITLDNYRKKVQREELLTHLTAITVTNSC